MSGSFALYRFILRTCLLYSSYGLSTITAVSEQGIHANIGRDLMNWFSSSFIQQIITWPLYFLNTVLAYKVVLMIIPLAMICTLYENGDDDASLQQKSSKVRRKRMLKKHRSGQQQKYHFDESLGLGFLRKGNHDDVEELRTEIQQNKMTESEEPKKLQQQITSSTSKEGHCSNQKTKYITEPLELKFSKDEDELDPKSSKAKSMEPHWSRIIKDDRPKDWVYIQHEGIWVYMYRPGLKKTNEQENHPISKVTTLSNSFIPLSQGHQLWINSEFYTASELIALAETSKYSYLQFKKLSSIIMSRKNANSYMLHPAYKTCVLDMWLRILLIQNYTSEGGLIPNSSESFEIFYKQLLKIASENRSRSYGSFRAVALSSGLITIYDSTVKHFLIRKYPEKSQWSFGEFQSSKNSLKEELKQIMKEYIQFRRYNFIPQNQGIMDQVFYEWLLKKMKSMNVPFCNSHHTSRLLISSREASLKLFLFWDIFGALKMEILSLGLIDRDKLPHLRESLDIVNLNRYIAQLYNDQDDVYLSNLYFEMVDFIQNNFFDNDQCYKNFQTEQQYLIIFDDYMRDIQLQIETFLIEVFVGPSVAIRVYNQ